MTQVRAWRNVVGLYKYTYMDSSFEWHEGLIQEHWYFFGVLKNVKVSIKPEINIAKDNLKTLNVQGYKYSDSLLKKWTVMGHFYQRKLLSRRLSNKRTRLQLNYLLDPWGATASPIGLLLVIIQDTRLLEVSKEKPCIWFCMFLLLLWSPAIYRGGKKSRSNVLIL